MTRLDLTIESLLAEAAEFSRVESLHSVPSLYGVTDGKAVGTYFEHKFRSLLTQKYTLEPGSAAYGIDFPGLNVDMKVTSLRQPQSSCPFKSARQKIYGLGYSLLVFVYNKTDDPQTQTGKLDILHVVFIDELYTADYQTTSRIREIVANDGNQDDLIGFMNDIRLPVDDIQSTQLAEEILQHPPRIGYLTISNALQWRLQYSRAIQKAGEVDGVIRVI